MRRRVGALLAAVVAAAGLAGCGNRLPSRELEAAAGLTPTVASPSALAGGGPTSPGEAGVGEAGIPLPDSAAPTATGSGAATPGSGSTAGSPPTQGAIGTGRAPAKTAGGPASADRSAPRPQTAGTAPGATPTTAKGAGPGDCGGPCAPLIIGSVGTYSGIVGQNIGGGVRAVQAWAAAANGKGGLNRHPVQVVVADDGGDPARHRSLIQQLVEERKVVAFVYNAAPLSGQASVDYVTKARIPVIGSEGAGEWFFQTPMFFPQHSSGRDLILTPVASAAVSMLPQGKKNLGLIYCSDGIQVCEDAKTLVPKEAPKFGFTYVYDGSGSLAQPDFTANCLAARDAKADMLLIMMDRNSAQRIARSCANVGYKPALLLTQTVENDALATDPNLDGSVGSSVVAPWFDAANPAVAEFRSAMAANSPGADLSGSPIQGWAAAKVLEKAAAAIANPPTADGILQGLWAMRSETLGGLTPPLTFTKDQPPPHYVCAWPLIIKGKKFANASDGKVRCR